MSRIQILIAILNLLFLLYISKLIVKGKLREEYAFIWWISAGFLVIFSMWTKGQLAVTNFLGVTLPANLIFGGLIFLILIYLLHISLVNSKLQRSVTKLTQELAMLKEQAERTSQLTSENTGGDYSETKS